MIEAVRSRFNTYYERNPMTYLEITLWSGVAAVAIAAMIAHRAWRRLKRDLAESLDKVDAQIGAVNRCRCRLIVANNQIESAYGTIASLAKDRIAVEKRARLHCRMIEDQRDRADAIWGHWAATQNDLDDAIENWIIWSTCPSCGRLVACKGPSPIGTCRHCDHTVTKTEICPVDPIGIEGELIGTAWNLYEHGRDIHHRLTSQPRRDLETTKPQTKEKP